MHRHAERRRGRHVVEAASHGVEHRLREEPVIVPLRAVKQRQVAGYEPIRVLVDQACVSRGVRHDASRRVATDGEVVLVLAQEVRERHLIEHRRERLGREVRLEHDTLRIAGGSAQAVRKLHAWSKEAISVLVDSHLRVSKSISTDAELSLCKPNERTHGERHCLTRRATNDATGAVDSFVAPAREEVAVGHKWVVDVVEHVRLIESRTRSPNNHLNRRTGYRFCNTVSRLKPAVVMR